MLRFVSLSSQFSLSHALRKLLRKTGNVHRQISKHILVPNWKVLFIYSQEILSKIAWYACGMQRINLSVIFMGQQNIPSIEDVKPPNASLESLELKLSHYRLKLWSAFSWPDLLQRVWWAKFYFSFLFFFFKYLHPPRSFEKFPQWLHFKKITFIYFDCHFLVCFVSGYLLLKVVPHPLESVHSSISRKVFCKTDGIITALSQLVLTAICEVSSALKY